MSISSLSAQSSAPSLGGSVQPASKRIPIEQTDSVHFQGKGRGSEVPTIVRQKPTTWTQWAKETWAAMWKWFSISYVLERLQKGILALWGRKEANKVLNRLKALTPESARAIMAEAPLDKITYAPVARRSTGISKATTFYGSEHPVMKHHKVPTYLHILEDYGIEWSRFKVARDALQNFYDGQGQTLEGVDIQVNPGQRGKQKVKIKASATYDVEKLLALGATGKKGQDVTAGGFGEGAKMMALILLRDYGANQVTFRSREWQADFTLGDPGRHHGVSGNNRGLMVKLTPLNPPISGNELEFETSDYDLAATIRDGNALFYNPKDPIFHNPTYENSTGGFKLLTDAEAPGRVYEAGQLRAFGSESNYDALPGLILWSNKKLLTLKDRDRVAIQKDDVETILTEIVDNMSLEETAQGIQTLRNHWFYQKPEDLIAHDAIRGDDKKAAEMLLKIYCERYAQLSSQKPSFLPEGLVGVDPNDLLDGEKGIEQLKVLYQDGYIPVKPALQEIGVPDGKELLLSRDAFLVRGASKVNTLTPKQQNQIAMIQPLLHSLASVARYDKAEVSKLAELPVQVVSMPQATNSTDYIKLSPNKKQIMVDKRLLDTMPFREFLPILSHWQREAGGAYMFDKESVHWVVDNLPQMQKFKAQWDAR